MPTNCVACIKMMPFFPPTATAMIWHATRTASRPVWLTKAQRVPKRWIKAPQMNRLTMPQTEVLMPRRET